MSKFKLYVIKGCIMLSIILNVLMIYCFHQDYECYSNIFAVMVMIGINIWIDCFKENMNSRVIRPEAWGIFALTGVSLLRFVNRIKTLSDSVNLGFTVLFVGVGVFLVFVIIGRVAARRKGE